MNRREMLTASAGFAALACFGGSGVTAEEKAADSLAGGDLALKNWLLTECKMEFDHLGIPTEQDMPWEARLEHLKLSIMEYKNDPFGIEWMKFDSGVEIPMPEIIVKRPHVAFRIGNFDEVVKRFKLLVPVSNPRPGMKTCFIEHKGIGIEFVSK